MLDWLYYGFHQVGLQPSPLTPGPYQTQPEIPYHLHRNYEPVYASARPRKSLLSPLARRPREKGEVQRRLPELQVLADEAPGLGLAFEIGLSHSRRHM